MPILSPDGPAVGVVVERTIDMIAQAANKTNTPLSVVATYLPITAGVYMAHVGNAGKFLSPVAIVKTNIAVFKKCMQLSGGSLTLYCVETRAICALQLIPGSHKVPAIMLCQTLVLFTNNV